MSIQTDESCVHNDASVHLSDENLNHIPSCDEGNITNTILNPELKPDHTFVDEKIQFISDMMMQMVRYAHILQFMDILRSVQLFDDEDKKTIQQNIKSIKKKITDEGKSLKRLYGQVYHLYIHMSAICRVREQVLQDALRNVDTKSPLFHYFITKQINLKKPITQMSELL